MKQDSQHLPVLLEEAIEGLHIKPEGIYIDATFGRGGHSRVILEHLNERGKLIAMDKDPRAIETAKKDFAFDPRFSIDHSDFANIDQVAAKHGATGAVQGILLDLGVSSPQLDQPSRGFSFLREGPLDMRMDTTQKLDAKTFINTIEEKQLADVLWQFGEEKFSRRIARKIVAARNEKPINTTTELADIIAGAVPRKEKHKHPATRSFQAIRIVINDELKHLSECLQKSMDVLAKGGRLSVISFHSLEDRIVKEFIRKQSEGVDRLPHLPIKESEIKRRIKKVGGLIRPTEAECTRNPRARSARLRVAEKLT